MSRKYLDGSTLDECIEARRQGRTLEYLAGKLGCDPAHLARLLGLGRGRHSKHYGMAEQELRRELGLPQFKPEPAAVLPWHQHEESAAANRGND